MFGDTFDNVNMYSQASLLMFTFRKSRLMFTVRKSRLLFTVLKYRFISGPLAFLTRASIHLSRPWAYYFGL